MKRFIFIILTVLVLSTLNISPLAGSLTLSPEIEKIFFEAVDHLYRNEFEEAFAKFDSISVLKPDDPMGYFCKAFVYDYIMDEYRTLLFMEQFEKEVETAIKKAEELEEKGNLSSEMYLFTGGAIGMRGIRRAMIGDWFDAFLDALKAAGKITKSLEIDSTMYDAYFGLGSYHYWKSVKSKIFWWLPFVSDQRQQGIDEIKLSIEKGRFTPIPSEVSLLRIYLEEKDFDEVIKLADKLRKSHDNINSLWFNGYALIYSEQWLESIDIYTEILSRLQQKWFHGIEGKVECYYYIALSHYHLGNTDKSKELITEKILSQKEKVDTRVYFYKNPIKGAEKLLKMIEEEK